MGYVAVSTRVIWRNNTGQFVAACSDAARKTIEEAVNDGAEMSKALAPSGRKADPRTIPLKQSIRPHVVSRTQGYWEATARHALPIEFGAGAHPLPGDVSFFWEKAGRMWIPFSDGGPPWLHDTIRHPGNAAQPYLRPAYKAIMARVMSIADKHYPG